MKSYHKARNRGFARELRLLEFDDRDSFNEDDETNDPEEEERRRRKDRGRVFQCPRCEEVTLVVGKHPYCTECNWDSLTDVCGGYLRWAS